MGLHTITRQREASHGNQYNQSASQLDTAKAEAFAGRVFKAFIESADLLSIYLGDRLGLYRALADGGAATPSELASRAKINVRYAREWLEQQAATGILEVDDASSPEDRRRYSLPPEHALALTDLDSPFSVSPVPRLVIAGAQAMPKLLAAYRDGSGVAWSEYGPDLIESQGDCNRPWLLPQFATEYLPSIKDVHARLQADPPARVADVACGVGWASIAVAKAYPKATVHGLDLDESSIALARKNAQAAGVADRVKFEVQDAGSPSLRGRYDLAVVIEAVHDLSKPVPVLRAIKGMLAPGGTLLVADERVGEVFTVPANDLERLY